MGAVESIPQVGTEGLEECDDSSSAFSFCRLHSSAASQRKKMHRSPIKQIGASFHTDSTIITTLSSYENESSHHSPLRRKVSSGDCWGGTLLMSVLSLVSPQKKNAIAYNDSLSDFANSSCNADIQECQPYSSDKESWASPKGVQDFPDPSKSAPPNEILHSCELRPPFIEQHHHQDEDLAQDPCQHISIFPRERFDCHDLRPPHQDDYEVLHLQNFLNTASKYEAESNLDAAISALENFLLQLDTLAIASFSRQHSRATALHKIGVLHWKCGRYFFSEHALMDTIHIYQCILEDSNHYASHEPQLYSQLASEIACVFLSMGRVYLSKGEGETAMHCYNECVRYIPHVRNSRCSSIATTSARIFAQACVGAGRALTSQGRLSSALKRYKRALKIQVGNQATDFHCTGEEISRLSSNDSRVPLSELAETLSHIGQLYEQRNDLCAMECHAKALSFYHSALDTHSVDIGYASNNIGHVYHRLGRISEAEDAFKTAHQIFSLHLGKNHRNTAGALLSLGQLYASQGQHTKALSTFKRVLRNTEPAIVGELLSVTYHLIACSYEATFRLQKALKYFQRELDVLNPDREMSVARLLHHMAKIAMQAVDCKGEYILWDQAATWLERSAEIYHDNEGNEKELLHLETSINETRKRMKGKAHC